MSIKVINRVWVNSNACSGELLVLLAIADHKTARDRALKRAERLLRYRLDKRFNP